jgi:hypothetical protein
MALARMLRGEEAGIEGRAKDIFEAKLAQMAKMEPIAPVEDPELPG